MASIDLTLSDFIVPGLGNYTPEFGTKLSDGKGLSTAQVNRNVMMPFSKQRPISIIENSTTGTVDADSRLVFANGGLTLTLGNASFGGCKVTVSAGFSSGTSYVVYHKSENVTESQPVVKGSVITLISDGDGYFCLYERIYNGKVMNVTYEPTGGVNVATPRWLLFDFSDSSHKSLKIKKDTHIPLDITMSGATERRWFDVNEDTSFDVSADMQAVADVSVTRPGEINGRDFYVYIVPDTEGVKLVVSLNDTIPVDVSPDYTSSNTKKIGQFHTLCVSAGSSLVGKVPADPGSVSVNSSILVKNIPENDTDGFRAFYTCTVESVTANAYVDAVFVRHPLRGFLAGDILPESVWCLTFRPFARKWDGMVYEPDTGVAFDIYLQSGKGLNTKSVFGGTTTRTRHQQNHQADMLAVGKTLPNDDEFTSAALGSNEMTPIYGAAEASIVTTGGHVDTASVRMVSFIGAEDCNGTVWQWLRDVTASGGSNFSTYDGSGQFGQVYGTSFALIAGGAWKDGAFCGARARGANRARSGAGADVGGRGVSRVIRNL